MKKLFLFLVLIITSLYSQAQTVNNFIQMSYATMSVYQYVVLSSTQKAGGTFTLSVLARDGGGRGPPNYPSDVMNIRIDYYSSTGTLLGYSLSNNSTTYTDPNYRTYSLSSTNCGSAGACTNVAYMKVSFTGNDGGYWAGNMGTRFEQPKLTFTNGTGTTTNLLYNPEFGVYGTYASTSAPSGWYNSTTTWGGNTHPQLYNNYAGVNTNGGGYSSLGGTTSGQAGGYTDTYTPTYASGITVGQGSTYASSQAAVTTRTASNTGNSVYIDQVGNYNTVTVTQRGYNNSIGGIGQQAMAIQGDNNNVTLRQGDPTGPNTSANIMELGVYGSSNTLNLNQGTGSTGTGTGTDVGGHYLYNYVNGNNNSVTTVQQNTTGSSSGQFISNTINGSSNIQSFTQTGAGGHQIFTATTGDSNTVTATQSGNGAHYLQVTEYGNSNDAYVIQSGNTKNNATINLTNNGAPASVTLQQSGGQTYSIDRTCTTTCGRVLVVQP